MIARAPERKTQNAAGNAGHGEAVRWLTVGANLDRRFGGVSAVMAPLLRSASADGRVTFDLAAFAEPGEDIAPIAAEARAARRYPLRGWRSLIGQTPDRGDLQKQIADAAGVHIHGIWQEHCAQAAAIARALRRPYVISAHGMLDAWALRAKGWKKSIYMNLVERRNLRGAACLHALTLTEAETYRRFAPGVPIAVIPNGADAPAAADSQRFLSRFPELRGRRLVLFLARLHPKKGLDLLLPAWKEIAREQPEAHLVIAGPDFEGSRARYERLARDLAIESRVTFTGMLDGGVKWGAFAAAELFVLPSYSEGLSVSVLEAMTAGVPVLVSEECHVAGIGEWNCGWVIPPDSASVTGGLRRFFALDRDAARELGRNGRALAAERYSWPVIGARMAALYSWIAGGPKPADFLIV